MSVTTTSKLDPIRHRLPPRERSRTFAGWLAGGSGRSVRPASRATAPRPTLVPEGIAEIRFAGPDDVEPLTDFYVSLDDDSRHRRFLQAIPRISTAMAEHVLTPPNSVLVATDHDSLVVAEVVFAPSRRIDSSADTHAEIAYAVSPSHRRRGLAGTMVRRALADAARAGEVAVEAMIGADNVASIALMRSLGATTRFDDGVVIAHLDLTALDVPALDVASRDLASVS